MSKALQSTLIHTLEVAVVLGVAIAISYFFPEHRETVVGILGLFLVGLAKFLRAEPSVSITDYVNQK